MGHLGDRFGHVGAQSSQETLLNALAEASLRARWTIAEGSAAILGHVAPMLRPCWDHVGQGWVRARSWPSWGHVAMLVGRGWGHVGPWAMVRQPVRKSEMPEDTVI